MIPEDYWPAGILVLILIILFQRWRLSRERTKISRGVKARQKRAKSKELQAERWLQRRGYKIEKRQYRHKTGVFVNGKWVAADVVIDILAKKKGKKYLIEVKTGDKAPSPSSPATRRQLLEYSLLFPDRKIYLFDMEREVLLHIEFPD